MNSIVKPVILCGGAGTRLWPLSRESYPKQFIKLIDGKSLLELTLERLEMYQNCIFIANENHRFLVSECIELSGRPLLNDNIIFLEPVGRNTAPAMLAATFLPDVNPSDLLLFLPADHYIPDVDYFNKMIELSMSAANNGFIVTFGVKPTYPSTEYGYIKKTKSMNYSTYTVEKFIEKPDKNNAEKFFMSGDYLWNAGIFICRADVLRDATKHHAPDISSTVKKAMKNLNIDGQFIRPDKDLFSECKAESIDYAVLEKHKKTVVIPYDGIWNDVGSWDSVSKIKKSNHSFDKLAESNISVSSENTFIYPTSKLVVTLGTSNLAIVDTPDALLVASFDKLDQLKSVVNNLRDKNSEQVISHKKIMRPWGYYDLVDSGPRFKVKRITVKPGHALSLQVHKHRSEHWIVVKGVAKILNGDKNLLLGENESTYIPAGVIHRLENPGINELEMIEVQSGAYLEEDDIVRFDDSYGRV